MNCFQKAARLVLAAEQTIAGTKVDGPEEVVTVLHKFLFGPVGFLLLGFRAIFAPLVAWGATTIALWLTLWSLSHSQPNSSSAAFSVAAFLAGGFITFMLPSGFVLSGVKASQVATLKSLVLCLAANEEALRHLREAVDVMKERCKERIKRTSMALGIAWAALLWLFTNAFLKTDMAIVDRTSIANSLSIYTLLFSLAAIGFGSYESAVRILFQTTDFALIDASTDFSDPASNAG